MAKALDDVCLSFKWGEFNPLVCVDKKGHAGDHCYVCEDKNLKAERERRRVLADNDYHGAYQCAPEQGRE